MSETELLAAFVPLLPQGPAAVVGTGDDAAVLAAPDGRVVVTTDVLVQDHHFRLAWGTPQDLGVRAAMQNLADVAAMGARPTALVVALVLPPATDVDWVVGLAQGLAAACEPHGVGVVGGDLAAGQQLVVAVTAHGSLGGAEPVLRSGARPGDVVAHAGVLGHAAAGYAALAAGTADEWPDVVGAFLRPAPPLAAGPGAARHGASAMLDVSDGLLRDAGRLARASGVTLDLDSETLPPAAPELADDLGVDPMTWTLTGGEDHGLLATFPADVVPPEPFRVIGRVQESRDAGPAVLLDGAEPVVETLGWDHFRRS
jgi:thiamine-monophosphate kinase